MGAFQDTSTDGRTLRVERHGTAETFECRTAGEADSRRRIIEEGLSWAGTPFGDCGDVKGPNGLVDCAMMLVRVYVDTGHLEPFDPRPYPPQWHLHQEEERFLGWIADKLQAKEIDMARALPGDVLVFRFGRCFSHGGLLINSKQIIHAFYKSKICQVSDLHETELAEWGDGRPRPVKAFSFWEGRS